MGHKIKEIRLERGMTQEELAKQSNVCRTTISNLENNKTTTVNTKTLVKLANALQVNVKRIFFDDSV